MPTDAPLDVEVWSDVICPWCRIGRAHLDLALAEFEHDLGQLCGLARAGFAADDHHLVRGHGARDLLTPRGNRQ